MQSVFRILYCSRNLVGSNEGLQQNEISRILERARANNSKHNVTGALLYNDGYFAQVLEGPQTAVEEVFEKIQRDPRHGDITVLEGSIVSGRDFPDWSMAHVHPMSVQQGAEAASALQRAMTEPSSASSDVLNLLRSLVVGDD